MKTQNKYMLLALPAAAEIYEQRQSAGPIHAIELLKQLSELAIGGDSTPAKSIAKKMCVFDYIIAPYALEGKTFVLPLAPDDDIPF